MQAIIPLDVLIKDMEGTTVGWWMGWRGTWKVVGLNHGYVQWWSADCGGQ